ncbi:putative membrane protein YeiB [Murinocardiopsis flavida]|uniref:Putative membrane protein YeiB n=1 Tax=Murinocardiopsis flavida TaxID=645275 RepID=A0A2P8DDY0_9ACTN|nr:DUF418 domain-containing protein [Murinocardiopsis flavida]PSK95430.1 putative membrane protein YeiB [Murinocardiopsis flavida]
MSAISRPPTRRGPATPLERSPAPDLARGVMLLLIVLSNTGFYLWAAEHGPTGWHPVDGSAIDGAVQFAMITALDLRVYPMFAFLFGYGMMQLFRRQVAAGRTERSALVLLSKRHLCLIAIGALHAGLLMAGDIVGLYGLVGLALSWLFIRRTNRTLLIAAGAAVSLLLLLTALTVLDAVSGAATAATTPSTVYYAAGTADWGAAAVTRLTTWLFSTTLVGGFLGFTFHAAMLLGFWAARRRVLERPGAHLGLLRATAAIGIPIGLLGGLPVALAQVGVLDIAPNHLGDQGPWFMVQMATGLPAGLGYAALFGLLAHHLSERALRGTAATVVAAVGKRSLSCYLAHSLLFAPLLAAWGLGLGAHFGSASMALFAIGVWLVVAIGAYALERAHRKGPAEAVLRRAVYGPAA